MKNQFTQFKKDLNNPLAVMFFATITAYIICLISMNIDKIIYFLGTSYYYIGISAGWIETF